MEIDLDLRSLIYKELYKVYGIHFLSHDIKVLDIDDICSDILEDGCRVLVDVKEHNYE